MTDTLLSIADVIARTEDLIAAPESDLTVDPAAQADALLAMGEAVLIRWLQAKGAEPIDDTVEGFRLLALHRQAARGNPSFNACRETCRELVYHRNLVLSDTAAPETAQRLRLGAMVARHLALFLQGKLIVDGLGDFCCSARPIRQAEPGNADHPTIETV